MNTYTPGRPIDCRSAFSILHNIVQQLQQHHELRRMHPAAHPTEEQ